MFSFRGSVPGKTRTRQGNRSQKFKNKLSHNPYFEAWTQLPIPHLHKLTSLTGKHSYINKNYVTCLIYQTFSWIIHRNRSGHSKLFVLKTQSRQLARDGCVLQLLPYPGALSWRCRLPWEAHQVQRGHHQGHVGLLTIILISIISSLFLFIIIWFSNQSHITEWPSLSSKF